MSRLRTLTWAGGVGVLAVTFAGAARLVGTPTTAPLPAPPAGLVGTTVHGVVDSDPPPVEFGPPAAAGQYPVDQVFVAEGQTVQADDKLVQFDDRQLRAKLDQARGKLAAAAVMVEKARVGRTAQDRKAGLQRQAVKAAEDNLRSAEEAKKRGADQLEAFFRTTKNLLTLQPYTEDEKARQRQENDGLFNADAVLTAFRNQLDGERLRLAALEANTVEADIRLAEAKVTAAGGLVAEAQAAVASCLVRAHRVGGVVEQLFAAPGKTFGPTARNPLLLLVPAGPRVVRAEVDPEFAYRVVGKSGAPVTVTDFTNTALTYPGVVRRVSTTFLPKRNAGLSLDPPKVLECVIDLPDPAPAGKPPLRVNQPVRVIFPQ